MKLFRIFFLSIMVVPIFNCNHQLRITNSEDFNVSSTYPLANPIRVGITSPQIDDVNGKKYIEAVADALSRNGSVSRVIYPYKASIHQNQVDAIIDISVATKYDGRWSNFFVNWPGFLIWAPAIWGYGYKADIETKVAVSFPDKKINDSFSVPMTVQFRQAEIDRTWTEISWLEVSLIALVGGFYMTSYDEDVTPEFMTKFAPQYAQVVVNRTVKALQTE